MGDRLWSSSPVHPAVPAAWRGTQLVTLGLIFDAVATTTPLGWVLAASATSRCSMPSPPVSTLRQPLVDQINLTLSGHCLA